MEIKLSNIKSVEQLDDFQDEYVYDIEVDDTHTFFGNDILVHNSIYVEFGRVVNHCNIIDPDKAAKISNILISLEKDSKGKVIYFEEGFYYEINGIIKLDIEKQSLIIDRKEVLLENIFDILLE